MKIKPKDIQDLIELGSNAEMQSGLILSFVDRDYINRSGSWEDLMRPLSNVEVIAVYKALIKLEGEFNWIGGSAASGIWVYRVLRERGLDDDYQLADYGLKNCNNPYIPFGSYYSGERTIDLYFIRRREKARRREIKRMEEQKFHERVKGRKEKRSAATAELRELSFEERGLIRAKLLEKYKAATIQVRLELIAADEKYPPELYPPEWIELTSEQINELPVELVEKLYDKLSIKTKGEWRKFARKLQKRIRVH